MLVYIFEILAYVLSDLYRNPGASFSDFGSLNICYWYDTRENVVCMGNISMKYYEASVLVLQNDH